jgi:antitoxin component HigA of HigAB toxin-antitoxin module
MKTDKVETEEEYDSALIKLDRLFDVEKYSPEFEQVQQLIDQISVYEKEHFKIME